MEEIKYNLSEWAIILYLKNNPGVSRIDLEEYFNVKGSRIGYVIKRLKQKDLIFTEKDLNNKSKIKYFLSKEVKT